MEKKWFCCVYNKPTRSVMGKKPGSSQEVLRWETLNRDILAMIFRKLDVMDLTMGASRVCISWFLASHDKTIWQTVDLDKLQQVVVSYRPVRRDKVRPVVFYSHRVGDEVLEEGQEEEGLSGFKLLVKSLFNLYSRMQGGQVEKGRTSVKKLLTEITKLSSTVPKNLLFNSSSYIDKKDLMFAAKRMPNIEKLVLPRWSYQTGKSCRFAFSQWKNLKTLIVAHDIFLNGFEFKAVGETCSNLTNFKYLGHLREPNADQIVRYFQKLKRLSFRCSWVCVRGHLSLISGLQNHVILNLTHCVFQDFDLIMSGSAEGYSTVPYDSLVQAAATHKLIRCSHDCSFCKGWFERYQLSSLHDSCWHPHDKDWQNDEIEEFVF